MTELPRVSILVLNFNGLQHLDRCFGSLKQVRYPEDHLEVLFMDNGSRDESVRYMEKHHSWVRVLSFRENLGYARAMNLGAKEATSEILVFLNNDTQVDPDFLEPLVAPLRDGRAVATASKILSWDGKLVQYAGGGTNFHGIAFQSAMGEKDGPEYREEGPTLFGCGAATAIRKDIFLNSGAFDEDFFAYYEDVDLGWRLWVLGHDLLFVPDSIVRHHHSATSLNIELYKLRVLHMRNPLIMILKNYEKANLRRILPAAILLSLRRTWLLASVDPAPFRIGSGELRRQGKRSLFGASRSRVEFEEQTGIPKLTVSDLIAFNDIVDKFPSIMEKREWIQAKRRRPDSEILQLFGDPFRYAESDPDYARFQDRVSRFFDIYDVFQDA